MQRVPHIVIIYHNTAPNHSHRSTSSKVFPSKCVSMVTQARLAIWSLFGTQRSLQCLWHLGFGVYFQNYTFCMILTFEYTINSIFLLCIYTFQFGIIMFIGNKSSQCNQFLMRFIFVSSLHFFPENNTLCFKSMLYNKIVVKCKSLRLLKVFQTNKTEKLIIIL